MIDNIINGIVGQVPNLVALIIVVMLFLQALEKRDKAYLERDKVYSDMMSAMLKKIDFNHEATVTKIDTNHVVLVAHAEETTAAIAEMHRTVAEIERRHVPATRKRRSL